MQILWIRHGQTPGNVQRRYVGRTDEGLTDEAKLCLQKKQVLMQDLCVQTEGGRNPGKWYHAGAFVPDYVYSSPMMRCRETAEILFPGQVLCVQEGLQETDFGDFEYKNYEELKENPAYQAWIDSGGQMMVPNGESGGHMSSVFGMHRKKVHSELQLCVMVVQLCQYWNDMEDRRNLFMNGRLPTDVGF